MKDEGAATDIAGPPRERAGLPTKGAEWLAPEPWGRTLWGVTKSTVVFGAVFWTGMSLMGEPVSLLQTGITALFVSAAQILTRRTGGSMPAAPSLVLGAVTLVVSVGAGVVAFVRGDRDPLMLTAVGGFLGAVLLWFGFRSRRHEKQLADSVMTDRVAPLLIPRAELAQRVSRFRTEQAPATRRVLRWIIGGGATFMALFALPSLLAPAYEPPEWVGALTFFGMWGVALYGLYRVTRRGRIDAERHGLLCPGCRSPLLGGFGSLRLMKVIEDAGLCPQCGVRITTEEHA